MGLSKVTREMKPTDPPTVLVSRMHECIAVSPRESIGVGAE